MRHIVPIASKSVWFMQLFMQINRSDRMSTCVCMSVCLSACLLWGHSVSYNCKKGANCSTGYARWYGMIAASGNLLSRESWIVPNAGALLRYRMNCLRKHRSRSEIVLGETDSKPYFSQTRIRKFAFATRIERCQYWPVNWYDIGLSIGFNSASEISDEICWMSRLFSMMLHGLFHFHRTASRPLIDGKPDCSLQ